MTGIGPWVKANRWAVALLLVLALGYLVGKDLALRDNVRDAAAREAGR